MKVLVTGGLGFIGSHLCERLLEQGHEVRCVDSRDGLLYSPAIKTKHLKALNKHDNFTWEESNILGQLNWKLRDYRPDIIYHLAALAGVRPSLKDPAHYSRVNVAGTVNVLDYARHVGCPKVFFASSSSVYGSMVPPFSEGMDLTAIVSPYALTKRQGELACDYYSREYGINIGSFRFFTVYGPRQRPDMFIRSAIKKVMEGEEITLYGDGSSFRDYTYVDDIIQGILAFGEYDQRGHGIYNLGYGQKTTLLELMEAIERAVGKPAKVKHVGDQKGDVPGTLADITHSRGVLGYNPQTPISEGIPKMVAWMGENS